MLCPICHQEHDTTDCPPPTGITKDGEIQFQPEAEMTGPEIAVAKWLRKRAYGSYILNTPWTKLTPQAQRQWLEDARDVLQVIEEVEEEDER